MIILYQLMSNDDISVRYFKYEFQSNIENLLK